ncbi:unnamed protein product [Moneuplotes crassus]|uniref:Uncharacterized protein n=1 Tax=Euplotes crassus TaxID=5936 RepID=A0AAD1Y1V3_EUPCR|nr:unnamed protein product [Moneuplotes crassus]
MGPLDVSGIKILHKDFPKEEMAKMVSSPVMTNLSLALLIIFFVFLAVLPPQGKDTPGSFDIS